LRENQAYRIRNKTPNLFQHYDNGSNLNFYFWITRWTLVGDGQNGVKNAVLNCHPILQIWDFGFMPRRAFFLMDIPVKFTIKKGYGWNLWDECFRRLEQNLPSIGSDLEGKNKRNTEAMIWNA